MEIGRQQHCVVVARFHVYLFLLLLFPLIWSAAITASSDRNTNSTTHDQLALLSFKSLISDDPFGVLVTWKKNSLNFCRWRGVTCGDRGGQRRVTALELESLDLVGSISPSIANLTFLEKLHLPDNRLQGPIPQEIGFLSQLQHLNLSINSLQGEIPVSLSQCSHLQNISLSNNTLHGNIPSNLSRCSNLQIISLDGNEFSGLIPMSLGSLPGLRMLVLSDNHLEAQEASDWAFLDALTNCSNLQILKLASNRLGGVLPSSVANLSANLEKLVMDGNQISGSIPPEIGNLANLAEIRLSSNLLTGTIPAAIGKLQRLQIMTLVSNQFSGTIPSLLGNLSSLSVLYLGRNSFTGHIPLPLLNISTLTRLDLARNNLTGVIPPSLGNLLNLTALSLAHNKFTGSIPPSLGYLRNPTILELGFNNFTGVIPPSLWNLSSLEGLGVENNMLSGIIPPDIGQILPNLRGLLMYSNQFHGTIPVSLSNASALGMIELNENKFHGTIPSSLGTLKNLHKLILMDNQLEARETKDWSFITALGNCTNLLVLQLDGNKLGGMLPNSISNLSTQLDTLTMGVNQISGSIPSGIGNLISLTDLELDENHLEGTIPATLGRLQRLQLLDLDRNQLSGKIPSTFGNLTQLIKLYLDYNNLSGSMPISLGNCTNLELLNLGYNKLTGTIPKEILTISSLSIALSLSHNSLTGSLPSEVRTLVNLGAIDVSRNNLSGTIPSSLSECQHLEYLDMGGNFFTGTIPSSLSELRGLQELDLSQNNISGQIPEFLGTFHFLHLLNLSFNNFEGQVPKDGVFGNVSAFSVLGNSKLCGGIPELNLSPCANQTTRKKYWSSRLLVIISVVTSVICFLLLLCFFAARFWRQKSRRETAVRTSMEDQHMNVSYAELLRATDGFSSANLVGVGSFGSVYKGVMDYNGLNVVAVKVLNLQQQGASRSFIAECEALRNLRHRNLVKILTACSSIDYKGNDFKALLFEFFSNGSLEKWLHPEVNEQEITRKLSLIQRLNIAIDVAHAFEYLHQHGGLPIVHCDLKPSNVLLDNDMTAHVGDFGLARFLTGTVSNSSQDPSSSIGLKGSIGYVAPEYGTGSRVSTHGDVYSYGILLLEMFTGKIPTDDVFKEGLSLHRFVEMAIPDGVMNIVDPELLLEEGDGEIRSSTMDDSRREGECITAAVLRIGISCSKESPMERIQMGDVTQELHAIRNALNGTEMQRERRVVGPS